MLADFVKEIVSAGGTGNLTLNGAVSGYQTVNAAIGTVVRFPYSIRDGTAWETGKGYISTSTNFVRETFHKSSTGSALNVTTAATVSLGLSADETAEETAGYPGAYQIHPYSSELIAGSATSVDNGEIHYIPIRVEYPDDYDAFIILVTADSGNGRFGLYDVKLGKPHNLIAVHDTSTAFATAPVVQAFTFDGGSKFLSTGWYFIGLTVDAAPVFEGAPDDSHGSSPLGTVFTSSSILHVFSMTATYTYATMPNPADLTSEARQASTPAPVIALRQG